MEKKNILITGGCGFIGKNLINFLEEKEDIGEITVIDNLSGRSLEGFSENVMFSTGDILDIEMAKWITNEIDVVIHLAAESGVPKSISDPIKSVTTNVIGTLNYLEASRLNGVKKFIFASSGGVIGDKNPPLHEEMRMEPISPYTASKASCEHLCNSYYKSFGLDTTILRFSNVYGPLSDHKKGNFIPEFLKSFKENKPFTIYGGGSQTRDFIYVKDLCNGIYKSFTSQSSRGHTFQLSTNTEITISNCVNKMNTILNQKFGRMVEIEYKPKRNGDVVRNYARNDKIKLYLDWFPQYDFEKGFKELINSINV